MCSCKSLVILLLFLAVSFAQRHDYKPCNIPPGDILLRRVSSAKSFKFLKRVTAQVNINVGDDIISCVHALDQWDDGTGGNAEFVKGGIGFNFVDVLIKSRPSRGFSFVIEVYGPKRRTCKYLRKCVYFRTCSHTHTHNTFRVERSLKMFMFAETAFVVSLSTNS
jgi:hypothetical protein